MARRTARSNNLMMNPRLSKSKQKEVLTNRQKNQLLFDTIIDKIKKNPTKPEPRRDYFNLLLTPDLGGNYDIATNTLVFPKQIVPKIKRLAHDIEKTIETTPPNKISDEDLLGLYNLHHDTLKVLAPYDFESYLLYMEWNRQPRSKFFVPRRKQLTPIVIALQQLADEKIHLLTVSMPPGTGKTTLAIFFLTWMAGKYPNEPMLSGSHSNAFIKGTYEECLRLLTPPDKGGEYLWNEVFPTLKISGTNAKDCRIDIDKRQRFETLEFTSIGTGNAGLYRASTLLYCDDLVSGIEVALSKDRLDKLWEIYTTDLRQRKIGNHCRELHIATRWSLYDVLGRLEEEYEGSKDARFLTFPAMNSKDESNFDYAYGVGFSTETYREQRDIMGGASDPSWRALYMNDPIEREGQLFAPDEIRRYFTLPDGEPDAIVAACDTKDRGDDFCVMPIGYLYGEDCYIDNVICDNGKPEIVETRLAELLLRTHCNLARFESNSAGGRVAQNVDQTVKSKDGITHITTKYTTANKETKIIVDSTYIKEHFLFKDDTVIQRTDYDYRRMMSQLFGYTMAGKNKHDDTPDALSQLAEYIESLHAGKVEIFKRPW